MIVRRWEVVPVKMHSGERFLIYRDTRKYFTTRGAKKEQAYQNRIETGLESDIRYKIFDRQLEVWYD